MQDVILPKTGFLADASPGLRTMLESQASEIQLEAGEILFEQGADGDALFAVVQGLIEITTVARDGRRLALDVMRPGALFGEIALFDPGPRTATADALQPSVVLRVRYGDIMRRIRDHPELAIDMIHLAGQRMRWMNRQLDEQVFLPVPTRLARKVLYLTEDGPTATLALTQSELAEFVGATREGVSKTLANWKRMGVAQPERGGLRVLDREGLQILAQQSDT